MSQYFVIASFELHPDQLDNWKTLSKEISKDMTKADGFISRDSGIDENGLVYCLVKWQSKTHQEAFMKALEARDTWEQTMAHFSSIANMETMKPKNLALF